MKNISSKRRTHFRTTNPLWLVLAVAWPTFARNESLQQRTPLVWGFQADSESERSFVTRGAGYSLRVAATDAQLFVASSPVSDGAPPRTHVDWELVHLVFQGANQDARSFLVDELPGKVHHFLGPEPSRWRTNVATHAKVRFADVYPGTDLVYYEHGGQLEYDFIVSPGFDPGLIRLRFEGPSVVLDDRGGLRLPLDHGEIRQKPPRIYQDVDGVKRDVAGGYAYRADGSIGFYIAPYDTTRALVIDPIVEYSSYLGGSGAESPFGDVIGVDTVVGVDGSLYIAGFTSSLDFPSSDALQPAMAGGYDAFVSKLDPAGKTLEFSTYLGGTQLDAARAIALGPDGYITVVGYTNSPDFPTTTGVVQPAFGGGAVDAFAARLDPTGSAIVFATFLGGSAFDVSFSVGVDGVGSSYLAGR